VHVLCEEIAESNRRVLLMPLLTVEGVYRDGKVELVESPNRVPASARVLVTFLTGVDTAIRTGEAIADDRESLRQQAFAQMKEGLHLGGPPYPRREELYDRFDR
jgi:hypothetical protein